MACPFKGLASFEVDDADEFFGRERLVAEMVARLAGAPLLGIVGPSGSGKSSVLKAGLAARAPARRAAGQRRLGDRAAAPRSSPARRPRAGGGQASPEGRLVIAVDQFEELFTACNDEAERAAFADALVAAVRDPRRRALVLIALRADFYGRCASYPELWRMLGANHVPVGPMRRDELRRAIVLPAQRAGLRVDAELVDALIADVEGEPGALPLLQTALLELWQGRDGAAAARSAAYEHAGGVRGAVARLAERVYERARSRGSDAARGRSSNGSPASARARRCVRRRRAARRARARPGRARGARRARRRPARDRQRRGGRGRPRGVAARMAAAARLARRGRRGPSTAPPPRHRRTRVGRTRARRRRSSTAARGSPRRSTGRRRTMPELDAARARVHRREPRASNPLAAPPSGGAGRRARRCSCSRRSPGSSRSQQRGSARDQATAADAQRLGARALLDDELDRSLLLARQGVALDDTQRTRGNLLGALLRSPAAIGIVRGGAATTVSAAVSPDGRMLAVGNNVGEVRLYDTRTRAHVATVEPSSNGSMMWALAFSPDGSRLAVGYTSEPGGTAGVSGGVERHRRARRSAQPARRAARLDRCQESPRAARAAVLARR